MDIIVTIQGIIMFVATSVYGGTGTNTGGALAVQTPVARPGKYGVELPIHEPRLIVRKADVLGGACTGRLVPKGSQECEVVLNGDRIQFGNYVSSSCNPIPFGAGATGDLGTMGVPDITKVLQSTALAADARPNGTVYSGINRALVAAWLDIPAGRLSVPSQLPEDAEFRPSLHRYRPATTVEWTVDATAPCLVLTPFGGSATTIRFAPTGSELEVAYVNMPKPITGHAHGRRGASYDFELMYDVLEEKPQVPPIPYHLRERPANDASAELNFVERCVAQCIEKNTVDPVTGENCGPGTNPRPKP